VLTRDDLIDLIIELVNKHLPAAPAAGASNKKPASPEAPKGRLFLTEYDIKKRLTPGGRRLTLPKEAIISPLATDWLILQGIEIVRE
jgi:hypothetical protein